MTGAAGGGVDESPSGGGMGNSQSLLRRLVSETEALFVASFHGDHPEQEGGLAGPGQGLGSGGYGELVRKRSASGPTVTMSAKERKKAAMRYLLVQDVASHGQWTNLFGSALFGLTVGAVVVSESAEGAHAAGYLPPPPPFLPAPCGHRRRKERVLSHHPPDPRS